MTASPDDIADLRGRIAAARVECDTWRASKLQEKYLEAYSRVEALELELDQLEREALASPREAASVMAQHSISYNGRQYQFGLYRYDQLADAIDYARGHPGEAGDASPDAMHEAPGAPERELMATLGITYRDGIYHLGTYRYDRLADAVAYARLQKTHT